MADPFTLAFLVAGAAKAASAIQQGRIADAEGRAQAKLAERNAQIAEQDAVAREQKAQFDSLRQSVAAGVVMGRLTARLGASGARLDVGAPIRVLSEQMEELELDNLLIGFEGQVDAARFREQAVISRFKGSLAKTRGKSARDASFFKAGTSLLSDFATGKAAGLV